jgi:hypothetical protein
MANEGRITISDGSTSFNIEPALLLEIEHRDDFSYRDLNGYVRAKDVSTYGKITGTAYDRDSFGSSFKGKLDTTQYLDDCWYRSQVTGHGNELNLL